MTSTTKLRAAVVTLLSAALIGAASPALGDSTAPAPTVVSVYWESYQYGSFMADSVYADWGNTPIVNRVYGTPGNSTNAPNMLLNPFPSIFRDSGTPRSRPSYRVGVCDPECDNGGIDNVTWDRGSIRTSRPR